MDFEKTKQKNFMYACYNHKCHTVHKGNSKKVEGIFYVVVLCKSYLPVMIWI